MTRHPKITPPYYQLDGAIRRSGVNRKALSLIFTGGETCNCNSAVTNALDQFSVPAAMFLTGDYLRNPENHSFLRHWHSQGHYLGPHSDTHLLYATWDLPPCPLVSREEVLADLEQNLLTLTCVGLTAPEPRLFLPPYEHTTTEISRWISDSGWTVINYTPGCRTHADYLGQDHPQFSPADELLQGLLDYEKSDPHGLAGFMLLSHLGTLPSRTADFFADLLPELISQLHHRGYQFLSLPDLLHPYLSRSPTQS